MRIIVLLFFLSWSLLLTAQNISFRSNGRTIIGALKEKTASLGIGDLDGDGRLDILESNSDAINYFYLNLGAK